MKNCIISLSGSNITAKAHIKLIEYYKPKNLFCILGKEEMSRLEGINYNEFYLFNYDSDYYDKIDANELIPLDSKIIEQFQPYFETAAISIARKRLNSFFIPTYSPMPINEIRLIIYRHLEYWNTIIEKYNIDTFISNQVPHAGIYYIIYALCKIKGVKTFVEHRDFTRVCSYVISDLDTAGEQVKPVYEDLKCQFKEKDIDEIFLPKIYDDFFKKFTDKSQDLTPDFMRKKSKLNLRQTLTYKYFAHIAKIILGMAKPRTGDFKSDLLLIFRYYLFKIKTKEYHDYWYNSCEKNLDLREKFIYMPLQVQPEATTTPLAGIYQNLELAVKILASTLPDDVFIYLKEHPMQCAPFRDKSFVDTLKKIKNVKLVSTKVDTYQLIEHSIAVASCTGTVLYENSFKQKTSIMFGQWLISYMPGVFKVRTKEECQIIVDEILNNAPKHSLKELKLFLLASSKIATLSICEKNEQPEFVDEAAIRFFELLKTNIEKVQ